MDTDMTDAAYDIDIDVGTGADAGEQQPIQTISASASANDNDTQVPAAYFENLDQSQNLKPWLEALNLQGVNNFDPNDPLYYAMEHCGADPHVKQLRWVNDSSVNLEFYSAQDAALALAKLTHPEAGDPSTMQAQDSRRAKPYSKRPDIMLVIRETNSGDQKARGAATRSSYYRQNPDIREGARERDRGRENRRRQPRRDFLDYDGVESRERKRRSSEDETMNDDSDYNTRRNRRNGNRERERDNGDRGRLRADVDSYRPGSKSPRESHFGRLRGRSASPMSDEEGDGRYGFSEEGTSSRRRYRSRSRSRNARRRPEPAAERWTHDRATFNTDRASDRGTDRGGRWQKDASVFPHADPMSNHRRSDAFDETANARKGSLLNRMTKDGQPVVPHQRSLASRITRDDEDEEQTYGRLKNDDSAPWDNNFDEPKPKPSGLAGRITRDDGDMNIRGRGRSTEGINIRGTASQNPGFSIRGAAS